MSGYGRPDFGPRGSVADYDRYGSTGSGDGEEMPDRVSTVRRRRDDRDYIDPQQPAGIFRDDSGSDDDSADGFEMSVSELLYSTSSFYAIVVPGRLGIGSRTTVCLFNWIT
jgi:hypothetical protein